MPTITHLPIIGLMGSGTRGEDDTITERLGRIIAGAGCHLLTGAGKGRMTAAARGFCSVENKQGLSIGIVPARDTGAAEAKSGYPNPFIEIAIRTHLTTATDPDSMASRNPINILTAHSLIFRPGGPGTASELVLARRYGRPVLAFINGDDRIGDFNETQIRNFGETTTDWDAARRFILAAADSMPLSGSTAIR